MSYLNKYQWELIPENLPKVKRNCPKCNEKTHYVSCEKFRVNANKNNIDIWLIYQCEKCKSTWNMTIYERIKPKNINKHEYDKFLVNDKDLARQYAFNIGLYNRNKAEIILEDVTYKVIENKLEVYCMKEDELVIEFLCNYLIDMRVDKFLSDKIGLSRNEIKSMHKSGEFIIDGNKNSLNSKIRNGMEIHVLKPVDNIKMLKAIG